MLIGRKLQTHIDNTCQQQSHLVACLSRPDSEFLDCPIVSLVGSGMGSTGAKNHYVGLLLIDKAKVK